MELFNKRLARLRKARGLSRKDVASKLGLPATTYRDWEYGVSITGEPYLQLAKILSVSVSELMGEKTAIPPVDMRICIAEIQNKLDLLKDLMNPERDEPD